MQIEAEEQFIQLIADYGVTEDIAAVLFKTEMSNLGLSVEIPNTLYSHGEGYVVM